MFLPFSFHWNVQAVVSAEHKAVAQKDLACDHKVAVRNPGLPSQSLVVSVGSGRWDNYVGFLTPSFVLVDAVVGRLVAAELVARVLVKPCRDFEVNVDIRLGGPTRDGLALVDTFQGTQAVVTSRTFGRKLPPSSDPLHRPVQNAAEAGTVPVVVMVAVDSFFAVAAFAALASSSQLGIDNAYASAGLADIALVDAFVA